MLPKSNSVGLTWRQPVVFVLATIVCTFLAIYAVVLAPVGSVAGVSGLYFAAAIYVPLALWFGVWGCLAGYLSCIFMGLYLGYSLPFVMVWGLADFFEGFIPLIIYRSIKNKPALTLKRPNVTYSVNILLAGILFVSALALINAQSTVFLATSIIGITLLLFQAYIEDRQTWITWLIVGVFIASVMSGIFGVGALAAFGYVPAAAFPSAFYGWILGDIVVLATLGTIITIMITPKIMKSRFYVHRYFT